MGVESAPVLEEAELTLDRRKRAESPANSTKDDAKRQGYAETGVRGPSESASINFSDQAGPLAKST